MTSSSPSSNSKPAHDTSSSSSSYFQKTVCLFDWWLTKAEDEFGVKKLAIAGFTSREKQPVRIFTSAPIAKRFDVFSLETVDGISVIITGFINKLRTTENGYSSDVFKHFVFGFPPHWEKFTEELIREEQGVDAETNTENVSEGGKSSGDPATAGTRASNSCSSPCKNKVNIAGSFEKDSGVGNGTLDSNISHENIENNPTTVENGCQADVAARVVNKEADSETQCAIPNLPPSTRESSTVQSKEPSTPSNRKYSVNFQSVTQTNESTPPMASTDTRNESPNSLGTRIISRCLRSLIDDQKEKQSPMKSSETETFKFPASSDETITVDRTKNLSPTTVCQSPLAKCSLEKPKKQTKKPVAVQEECVPKEKAKSPSRNLKSKKKEQKVVDTGYSSRTKSKRKIDFDKQETPRTQKKKKGEASTTLPESSIRRSRSGRKLLPTLEFWRNQLPVYDADHRLTDIKEGLDVRRATRGSRSEPQKSRRRAK